MQQEQVIYPIPPNSKHIVYTPEPMVDNDGWYHAVLGYPKCPLIGRYNGGEYRIADIHIHLQFVLQFQPSQAAYCCGNRLFILPQFLIQLLRDIPQVIPYNKPKNLKNQPDVHLTHHHSQNNITFNWIVSYGPMGKDFLNYLNHTYVFEEQTFFDQKLKRTTDNIPIVAYMPQNSGLYNEEVERGICITHFRSQYMSIHLKGGAPAFSPNNMRVGVEGMKKVVSKPNVPGQTKKNKKKKGKNEVQHGIQHQNGLNDKKNENQPKQQNENPAKKEGQTVCKQEQRKEIIKQQCQLNEQQIDFGDLFEEISENKQKNIVNKKQYKGEKEKGKEKEEKPKHQGFIHFYTAVLLQNDHRVNYHWHIEDPDKQNIISQLLQTTGSLHNFIQAYHQLLGQDPMIRQLASIMLL